MNPCLHSRLYLTISWLKGAFGAKPITRMFYLPGQALFAIEFFLKKPSTVSRKRKLEQRTQIAALSSWKLLSG